MTESLERSENATHHRLAEGIEIDPLPKAPVIVVEAPPQNVQEEVPLPSDMIANPSVPIEEVDRHPQRNVIEVEILVGHLGSTMVGR